jgi:ketosteroid isomerase-like protein
MPVSTDARSVVERWYTALAEGDVDGVIAGFHRDLVASVIGSTPVSGKFEGRDAFLAGTLGVVYAALDPQQSQFAQNWTIFAVDGQRVVGLMTGDAMGSNGRPYDSVYCQLFTIGDGQIIEYFEFLDTVVIESALFDNPLARPSELQREKLSISRLESR